MTNKELGIVDCLCPNVILVDAYQRYKEVAEQTDAHVFVVFTEQGELMGLVTERQAALFPNRIFADLLLRRQPPPVDNSVPILSTLNRMEQDSVNHLMVVDGKGQYVGIVSRLSIITALVERERDLRKDLEHLLLDYRRELENRRIATAVFEATSEGIMVTDAKQRIQLVNRAFSKTTGWAVKEAIGQTPHILHSGKHDEAFYKQMWDCLQETGAWEGEIWNRRKSGDIYPEWLHINAIRNDQGEVRYYAGVFSDATHHQEMRARLHHLAYHDALTGLPNRQLFLDRLTQAVAQARRDGDSLALLFIDLDGFKEVNDTLGHLVGDKLLCQIANLLQSAVRENDTVARLGGDEFTVITQTGTDQTGVITIAEKLLSTLTHQFNIDGHELFVSASIGISRFPEDGDSPEVLLMEADNAMYQAKAIGRGRYHFYSASGHNRFVEKVQMSARLRQALAEKEITIAWQPQVNMATGGVVGMEALARWSPDGKAVSPELFITLAEQTGLINQLGEQVLQIAAGQAAAILAEYPRAGTPLSFAINLSPFQVNSAGKDRDTDNLADTILGILTQHGLPTNVVELELTETAVTSHREGISDIFQTLGDAGIQIAVDDFGTGCSNLATIKQLPVHKLKLDRSLVMDLCDDPTDREIATAVITMARALNLKVVAEGVETEEQAAILRTMGCDIAQGYLYSRPLPMTELRSWLAKQAD
ncbi:EAL domain-containing protein [Sedimenticola selenatireducens]|uniref:putative bifunctional diguanylate cyclase/phosphodiesterase n=1 Tax=Sedimenticola selenatireducens TaxID=191960 RepID=UPI002AAA8079|nr:EAL domain-containing protein [Sedimenticola selenatireducens]